MGTNTFANNFEICSKSSSGKTIAAMPDPCFTPPPTPAGVEVVIPYPNTAMATDLDKGSTKVLICNKMAALEKKSCMKTSSGNEAAKPSTMKGGVMTMTTKGKAYFTKWSQDVKFEGKGVCRHIDLTTHNHGSSPGHCVPMPFMSSMDMVGACKNNIKSIKIECKPLTMNNKETKQSFDVGNNQCKGLELLPTRNNCKNVKLPAGTSGSNDSNGAKMAHASAAMSALMEQDEKKCLKAIRCVLQSYRDTQNKNAKTYEGGKTRLACCPGQSGHHVVPKSIEMPDCWKPAKVAPCICVEGVNNSHGTHGKIHRALKIKLGEGKEMDCHEVLNLMSQTIHDIFPDCDSKCINAQLKTSTGKTCPCDPKPKVTAKSGCGGSPEESKKIGKK